MNREYQENRLEQILKGNKAIYEALAKLSGHNLPDYYIAGGCIAQTVWNHLSGKEINYGIEDIDPVYFDASDVSLEAEEEMIKNFQTIFLPAISRWILKIRQEYIFGTRINSGMIRIRTVPLKMRSALGKRR